jgi:hypothetical protein
VDLNSVVANCDPWIAAEVVIHYLGLFQADGEAEV